MNTFGLQRLVDSNQRVFGNGVPVYYVYDLFDLKAAEFTELGRGFATGNGGTQSKLIDPPPQVSATTLSYVSAAITAGVALRTGSVRFTISDTWVVSMQRERGFATPKQVFEDRSVEGLHYQGTLYTIVRASSNEGDQNTLSWDVLCNGPDV